MFRRQYDLGAIAKVDIGGRRGTAFFVADKIVLTALHVVARIPDKNKRPDFYKEAIELIIAGSRYEAEVIHDAWSVPDDWVLLKCLSSPTVESLPLHELSESPVTFWTYGYPNRQPIDGMTYDGRIVNHRSRLRGVETLQLFSDQIAAEHPTEDTDEDYALSGLSGAPVLVNGSVVGIVRFVLGKNSPQAGTAYATPIKMVLASDFSSLLPPSDPFWGLPALPPTDPPDEPFRHLAQYQKEHAPVFFGRGWEIRELYDAITAPREASPPVVFVIGQSGVGKSSLLTAGLMPRLETGFRVKYFRRSGELLLSEAMNLSLDANNWLEEEQQSGPTCIILDQAEEPFQSSVTGQSSEIQDFMTEIRNSFQAPDDRPQGRLVLSFRKEWLQEWTNLFRENAVPFRTISVGSLSNKGIQEIVLGLASSERLRNFYNIRSIDDSLAEYLSVLLSNDIGGSTSPLLQIWMTELWRDARSKNLEKIDINLDRFKELDLKRFSISRYLNSELDKLSPRCGRQMRSGFVFEFLNAHINDNGDARTLSPYTKSQLFGNVSIRPESDLEFLEDQLKHIGILIEPGGPNLERGHTRLVHDLLVPEIRRLYDSSELLGQKASRILKNRSVEWRDGNQGPPLDEHDLDIVIKGQVAMRNWNQDEQRLIIASRNQKRRNQAVRYSIYSGGSIAVLAICISTFIAWSQFRSANNARNELQIAYSESVDELVNSTIELGFSNLRTDPSLSLKLALSAIGFPNSDRAPDLLRSAVVRLPMWANLKPDNWKLDTTGLIPEYRHPTGPFLFNKNISRAIMIEKNRINLSLNAPGRTLVLKDIPSGEAIDKITLNDDQVLYNKGPLTSGIAVIRNIGQAAASAKVYLLDHSGFDNVAWSTNDLVDISTSQYGWPAYTIDSTGNINRLSYDEGTKTTNDEHLLTWRGAEWIISNRDGSAILIIRDRELKWINFDEKGVIIDSSTLKFEHSLDLFAQGGLGAYSKFEWGPQNHQIYMLRTLEGDNRKRVVELFAIDLETKGMSLLNSYAGGVSRKDIVSAFSSFIASFDEELTSIDADLVDGAPFFLTADATGNKVAVTRPDDRYGTFVEILNLTWNDDGSISQRRHHGDQLVGRRTPGKRLSVTSAAISPSGNYTAVGSFLKDEDVEGTSLEGVGIAEHWGTFALDSGRSVPNVRELIAEPISTDLEESLSNEAGMPTIVGMAYSVDGTRLALCHGDGSIKIFRVSSNPSYSHVPSDWEARLSEPRIELHGPLNRFAMIEFGDGEFEFHDLKMGETIDLSFMSDEERVLGFYWSKKRSSLLVTTNKALYELEGGMFVQRQRFSDEIISVRFGEVASYFLTANKANFMKTISLTNIGSLEANAQNVVFFEGLKRGADQADSSARSLIEWVESGNQLRTTFDSDGEIHLWTLNIESEDGTLEISRSNRVIPYVESSWNSDRKLYLSGQIWRSVGSYQDDWSDVIFYDLATMDVSTFFEKPTIGWPKTTYEIEHVHETELQTTVIFRYSPEEYQTNNFVVGVWERSTGKLKKYFSLGQADRDYGRNLTYTGIDDTGELAFVGFEVQGMIELYELNEGTKIYKFELKSDTNLIPHLTVNNSGHFEVSNLSYFRKLERDLSARGVEYWQGVTTTRIPTSLDERLNDARSRVDGLQ